jgi:(p)ppGpp synthase/HD superfamily hydrolase
MHLTDRFSDAVSYAIVIHAAQTRKSTDIPYISHLLGVASLVIENNAEDEDEAIAALLHDAAEDQGGLPRLEDIRTRYGAKVAHIVEGCSDTFEVPKPDWRTRKETYIAGLREHIALRDDAVVRVSLADKVHNARAILADHRRIGDEVFERFTGKRGGTLWYYQELEDIRWIRQPDGRGIPCGGPRTRPS